MVEALNTMSALMVDPAQLAGVDHTSFVSGDDDAAKKTVTDLLAELGHRDVIDLGDITTARGSEMYLPLWARLWAALDTPVFSIKVVGLGGLVGVLGAGDGQGTALDEPA